MTSGFDLPLEVTQTATGTQLDSPEFLSLPSHLLIGMTGRVRLASAPFDRAELSESEADSTDRVWRSGDFGILIRGASDEIVSPGGWQVFVFGESSGASVVASVLDEATIGKGRVAIVTPTQNGSRRLSWSTLPRAAVVAVHLPSGTISLMIDGAGWSPLYYSVQGDNVYFSSNLSVLRRLDRVGAINTDKICEMLVFGHRGGSRTVWQGINIVPPGTVLSIAYRKQVGRRSFWSPSVLFGPDERKRLEKQTLAETLSDVRSAVDQSLLPISGEARLAVPCGGGVDSSFLGVYLAKKGHSVTYWCINQPEAPRREEEWMRPFSENVGIRCEFANITREDFLRTLLRTLEHTQQPAIGPNFISGSVMRRLAVESGESVFVQGNLADVVFGGASSFRHLSWRFRLLRVLSRLPGRARLWLGRALVDLPRWLLQVEQVAEGNELASIGCGDLERAEYLSAAQSFRYPGQSNVQFLADQLTWLSYSSGMSTLGLGYYERDETYGGTTYYPFSHSDLLRLGIHLPYYYKYRNGHAKWLWRRFVTPFIGRTVAYRRKYAFPTMTERWLDRGGDLLHGGFVDDLLCADVGELYAEMKPGNPARWTLVNLELWGRLHCMGESSHGLLERLL